MSAEYNADADLDICCSCPMCRTGRTIKGIPEPTQAEQVAAISRLEADKREKLIKHADKDRTRVPQLLARFRELAAAPGAQQSLPGFVGVGRDATLQEALNAALKRGMNKADSMRAAEELLVWGRTSTLEPGKVTEELRDLSLDEQIKNAFATLTKLIKSTNTFLSENNKELTLMRIREAEILWEDT